MREGEVQKSSHTGREQKSNRSLLIEKSNRADLESVFQTSYFHEKAAL